MLDCQTNSADNNLQKLVAMRSTVIAAELLAIFIFVVWKSILLPLTPLLLTLMLMVALNLWTLFQLKKGHVASKPELLLQIIADIAAFSVFLYFTGGATNPFGWFFLLPIMVSATLLPRTYTMAVALLTIAIYSLLIVKFIPLGASEESLTQSGHMNHGSMAEHGFSDHVIGMWLGFVFAATLAGWFVAGLAESLRQRDQCLAEVREQALRDERLVALGTLATSAAHELGTPLGTIALLTESMAESYPSEDYPELHESLSILESQLGRCKETLSVLSADNGEARVMNGKAANVVDYLESLVDKWKAVNPSVNLNHESFNIDNSYTLLADTTVTHALINVLDNAAEESPERVDLTTYIENDRLLIEVRDWGSGMSEETVKQLGTQQFTTKEDGLGIGLYLAYAAIKRMGGKISHCSCGTGCSKVEIHLPLLNSGN